MGGLLRTLTRTTSRLIHAPDFWFCLNQLVAWRMIGGGSTTMWVLTRLLHR